MQDRTTADAQRPSSPPDNQTDERVSGSMEREGDLVIPVIAEDVSVEKARVVRGAVRVRTHAETSQQTVATPLIHEEVVVERVPIDRRVDGPPPEPREENGTLVIPVLEEVAVVEKRLILREEVRVTCRRTTATESHVVTLRREVADVERVDPETVATTGSATGELPRSEIDSEQDSTVQKKGGSL